MSTYTVTQRFAQVSAAGLLTTLGRRVLAATLTLASVGAMAGNRVEDVSYASAPDGTTEITIRLASPPTAPRAFATESPPRIAVDFEDTQNGLTERRINVGSGAAASVSAVEAGGRTRVVVELFHPAAFESRIDGNNLILAVGKGKSMAASAGAPAASGITQPTVSQVDFRRGTSGEGRVVVSFDKDGAGTDLRKEGNKLIVDLFDVSLSNDLPIRLDVTDFATPVQFIETRERAGGARMEIQTSGSIEHMAYQTGNELVIEIAKVSAKDDERKKLGEPVEYNGTPVTFNIQDIPVRSALQLIADVSELNIVVADSVQGNVTLRLVNVPWDQALDIILQAKGLDKRSQGNVVWIAPTAEIAQREQALEDARIALEDRAELVTEYIPVNYGNAEEIAKLLTEDALQGEQQGQTANQQNVQKGFLSKRGSVTFDKRTNTLLVNDTADKIKELKSLIALLDRPVDQVLIEARIVVASDTFSRELGARFGVSGAYEDHHGNIITSSGTIQATDQMINRALANRLSGRSSGLPVATPGANGSGIIGPSLTNRLNVNLPASAGAGSFGWSVLAADYILDLELSALQTEGRGEVVASPRVITANQREAVIRQGDEVGYVTISAQGGAGGIPIPQVQFKDILMELKVTPTITQDDRIFLAMNVKKDELAGFISTSIGDVPQINKRELNTAVLVENGQTVVLGGVYEFKTREDLAKVPFLGDLPALGNLFKKKTRETSKAELLIFVTPKILRQRGKN
ncbi:MAG TPA: type IV pilus secretin PilQ [Patescibacteria group bacterium]|nr:type IV pilus secretin PilQ [Patescibacteria group bacterium]